jgi:hypothetical protein
LKIAAAVRFSRFGQNTQSGFFKVFHPGPPHERKPDPPGKVIFTCRLEDLNAELG